MDNEERMITWCRMWSENPSLAYELMTDSCLQWSAQTPGLDGVIGPRQAVDMMTAYRAEHINVFRPRVLVDGGDRFAYSWDVTGPDGTVRSGMDFNILQGGRVERNWTFVGDVCTDWAAAEPLSPADRAVLVELADWSHQPPVIDADRGRVAQLRTIDGLPTAQLLIVRNRSVVSSWTFHGARPFNY